jgi:hypothetical protein
LETVVTSHAQPPRKGLAKRFCAWFATFPASLNIAQLPIEGLVAGTTTELMAIFTTRFSVTEFFFSAVIAECEYLFHIPALGVGSLPAPRFLFLFVLGPHHS